MPRKNLSIQYQCNVSPAQEEAIQKLRNVGKSQLIRNLLRQYVVGNGGQWTDSPGRGKHIRKSKTNQAQSSTESKIE